MHAGRVACCRLMSHAEYADGTDRRTEDGRHTVTLRFPLHAARVITFKDYIIIHYHHHHHDLLVLLLLFQIVIDIR